MADVAYNLTYLQGVAMGLTKPVFDIEQLV
jgi:hypothetical protein